MSTDLQNSLQTLAKNPPRTTSDPAVRAAIDNCTQQNVMAPGSSITAQWTKNFSMLGSVMGHREVRALCDLNGARSPQAKNDVLIAELKQRGLPYFVAGDGKYAKLETAAPTELATAPKVITNLAISAAPTPAPQSAASAPAAIAAPSLETMRGAYLAAFGYAYSATHDKGEQAEYEAIHAALYETAIEVPGLSFESLARSGVYQREMTSGRAKSSRAMSQKAVDRFLATKPSDSVANLPAQKTADLTGRARFNASIKIK